MTRRQKESGALGANTVRGWRWRAQTTGAALAASAMMLMASTAAAYKACPTPTGTPPVAVINACCRITKPGFYELAIGGVNVPPASTGGVCIKIMTSGVALYGRGNGLYGNGTGTGIHLLPAAAGDVVYSIFPITDFKTGIVDDAPRSVVSGVIAESNVGDGIVVRANRVTLLISTADSNSGNGIVVKPLAPATVVSNFYLDDGEASQNTKAGLWLDSLNSSMVSWLTAGSNSADSVDLIDSVDTTISGSGADGGQGDGIKIVGGHNDVVSDCLLSGAIGLEVRNSAFDTIQGNGFGATGDGLLVVRGKHETIVDDASNNTGGSGIHLKRTTSSRVYDVSSSDNAEAGIWLDGSSGITVERSSGQSNATSAVYIGCSSAQKPDGTTCASQGLPASNGNRIANNHFDSSSTTPKPYYGIGIDRGNHSNQVLSNTVKGDSTYDLMDDNTNCDSNVWMFNTVGSGGVSPGTCIPTFP